MGRVKGSQKTGGRKKGTANKLTADFKKRLFDIVNNNIEDLNDFIEKNKDEMSQIPEMDLMNLKLQLIKSVLPYVVPKQAETKISVDEETTEAMKDAMKQLNDLFT
jgi:hypothetical protein